MFTKPFSKLFKTKLFKTKLFKIEHFEIKYSKTKGLKKINIIMLIGALNGFLTTSYAAQETSGGADNDSFFSSAKSLCGTTFEGRMTFPLDGQDSFKGKVLTAQFKECKENSLLIPFQVGDDTSRTWQLARTDQGLLFKHEHRHDDGSLDEVTNYGGYADQKGSDLSQSFPADDFTRKLIPAASTNVWRLTFSPDLKTLTYHLERHQKPRFTAVLSQVEP